MHSQRKRVCVCVCECVTRKFEQQPNSNFSITFHMWCTWRIIFLEPSKLWTAMQRRPIFITLHTNAFLFICCVIMTRQKWIHKCPNRKRRQLNINICKWNPDRAWTADAATKCASRRAISYVKVPFVQIDCNGIAKLSRKMIIINIKFDSATQKVSVSAIPTHPRFGHRIYISVDRVPGVTSIRTHDNKTQFKTIRTQTININSSTAAAAVVA